MEGAGQEDLKTNEAKRSSRNSQELYEVLTTASRILGVYLVIDKVYEREGSTDYHIVSWPKKEGREPSSVNKKIIVLSIKQDPS